MLLLLIISFFSINFNFGSVSWFSVYSEFLLLQLLLIFYLNRVISALNSYQLLGYAALFIFLLGGYLFLYQLDVFACFLLVSESVVLIFACSMLIHLNVSNISSRAKVNSLFIIFIYILFTGFCGSVLGSNTFQYYVDWYADQLSGYNDLFSQYVLLYRYNGSLVIFVGVWLLLLTFLLVSLVRFSLSSSVFTNELSYSRQYQNMWDQWYKKPVLRFFSLF